MLKLINKKKKKLKCSDKKHKDNWCKMHLPNLNYKLIGIGSGCAILFGILNGYFIFPQILKAVLKRVRMMFLVTDE